MITELPISLLDIVIVGNKNGISCEVQHSGSSCDHTEFKATWIEPHYGDEYKIEMETFFCKDLLDGNHEKEIIMIINMVNKLNMNIGTKHPYGYIDITIDFSKPIVEALVPLKILWNDGVWHDGYMIWENSD